MLFPWFHCAVSDAISQIVICIPVARQVSGVSISPGVSSGGWMVDRMVCFASVIDGLTYT